MKASAQFSASGTGHSISLTGSNVTKVDAVFLFNGITADNQVQFSGAGINSYVWTKYDGTFMSNQSSVSVEDGTGYILTVNGGSKHYYIWVIDYQNYLAQLNSLTPVEGANKCTTLSLSFGGTIPSLTYVDSTKVTSHSLNRQFTLTYPDLQYSSGSWSAITQTQTVTAPVSSISVSAPFEDTKFTLSGDQYATLFSIPVSVSSATYTAIRTKSNLAGSIIVRGALNEIQEAVSPLEGSGPLNVSLKSNANLPVTQFYQWNIYNVSTPASYDRYTDTDLRYIFSQTGTFRVKLTTYSANEVCSYTDSVTVIVDGSRIDVPNVFTPNGDGMNDEFKVSYESIAQYQILVYSSWAGKVYSSTDPAAGWDGRVGGRLAPPGVYYYLINAVGTDGRKIKLKGSVTLLRAK